MVQLVSIGKAFWANNQGLKEQIYFIEKGTYGVTVCCAKARYGKSCLVNTLMAKLSTMRKIICFDYRGEHKLNSYANFRSKDSIQAVEKMKIIENFGFKVSDFDKTHNWTSLGFTDVSAPVIAKLARTIYGDTVEEFNTLIDKLGTKDFSEEYPDINLPDKLNSKVVEGIKRRWATLSDQEFFMKEDDDRKYIKDWYLLLESNYNYVINMNLSDSSAYLARAMVGKILESMQSNNCRYLIKNRPCFIFEEADLVFPYVNEGQTLPSSNHYIDLFTLKYQKYHVECIFIIQDPKKLYEPVITNTQTWILGQHRKVDAMQIAHLSQTDINKLQWKPIDNYRQFIIIGDGMRPMVFEPEDVSCHSNGLESGWDKICEGRGSNLLLDS